MNKKGFTLVELLIVLGVLVSPLVIYAVSCWTDRNLDFWISHFKGHQVHVSMWLAAALTLVLNGVAIALNVIGEVARYCI